MRIRDREGKIGGECLIHRVDYKRHTCRVMLCLLCFLLSVSDCFTVYSGIIYFLVPPSCEARLEARD